MVRHLDTTRIKVQAKRKRRCFFALYWWKQGRPNRIKYTCCTDCNVMHTTSYITIAESHGGHLGTRMARNKIRITWSPVPYII